MPQRAIVTLSELNGLKGRTIRALAAAAELTVLCDAKYARINAAKAEWADVVPKVRWVDYQEHLHAFGRKVDRFNGKFANNPAKLAALLSAAGADGPVWVFEDDVVCTDWARFLGAYDAECADLLATTAPLDAFPWFGRGWLVGDARHASRGAASLFAFRVSPAAARAVLDALRAERASSHHELFVPWAVDAAGLAAAPLLAAHMRHMRHNASHGDGACLRERDCSDGLIFHPVKAEVSSAQRRLAKCH